MIISYEKGLFQQSHFSELKSLLYDHSYKKAFKRPFSEKSFFLEKNHPYDYVIGFADGWVAM
jgi:hypothetical protein